MCHFHYEKNVQFIFTKASNIIKLFKIEYVPQSYNMQAMEPKRFAYL